MRKEQDLVNIIGVDFSPRSDMHVIAAQDEAWYLDRDRSFGFGSSSGWYWGNKRWGFLSNVLAAVGTVRTVAIANAAARVLIAISTKNYRRTVVEHAEETAVDT